MSSGAFWIWTLEYLPAAQARNGLKWRPVREWSRPRPQQEAPSGVFSASLPPLTSRAQPSNMLVCLFTVVG